MAVGERESCKKGFSLCLDARSAGTVREYKTTHKYRMRTPQRVNNLLPKLLVFEIVIIVQIINFFDEAGNVFHQLAHHTQVSMGCSWCFIDPSRECFLCTKDCAVSGQPVIKAGLDQRF